MWCIANAKIILWCVKFVIGCFRLYFRFHLLPEIKLLTEQNYISNFIHKRDFLKFLKYINILFQPGYTPISFLWRKYNWPAFFFHANSGNIGNLHVARVGIARCDYQFSRNETRRRQQLTAQFNPTVQVGENCSAFAITKHQKSANPR